MIYLLCLGRIACTNFYSWANGCGQLIDAELHPQAMSEALGLHVLKNQSAAAGSQYTRSPSANSRHSGNSQSPSVRGTGVVSHTETTESGLGSRSEKVTPLPVSLPQSGQAALAVSECEQ